MLARVDNQEVGLEAAILERVRNSSLVESALAPTMDRGLRPAPKPRIVFNTMVGERCRQQRRSSGSTAGAATRANAGLSSARAVRIRPTEGPRVPQPC